MERPASLRWATPGTVREGMTAWLSCSSGTAYATPFVITRVTPRTITLRNTWTGQISRFSDVGGYYARRHQIQRPQIGFWRVRSEEVRVDVEREDSNV